METVYDEELILIDSVQETALRGKLYSLYLETFKILKQENPDTPDKELAQCIPNILKLTNGI